MKKIITIYLFASTLIASAQRDTTKTYLIDRTTSFIKAYSAKQQPNSTVDDVDHFLSFFADDFKDEPLNTVWLSKIKRSSKRG